MIAQMSTCLGPYHGSNKITWRSLQSVGVCSHVKSVYTVYCSLST